MSKENRMKFFKRAAAEPELREKLNALERAHLEEIAALAKEEGFEIAPEDFAEGVSPLTDSEMEGASGSFSPSPWGSYCTTHGCSEGKQMKPKKIFGF